MGNRVKKIGITGGIGSGKTHVCKVFESLKYKVYYADAQARRLMESDKQLVYEIRELFGPEAYLYDGKLNRKFVGNIVFKQPEMLEKINGLVHPAVGRDFERWYEELLPEYSLPFVLKEAAILFESGSWRQSDGIISVYAPKKIRLKRVMERDQASELDVLSRMDKQWSSMEKNLRSDFIIINDGNHHISSQVIEAIKYFREKPRPDNR